MPHRPPFHAHAPKVSFTAISREVLEVHSVMDSHGWTAPGGANPMVHVWIVPQTCGPFSALEGVGAGQILPGQERLCDHVHGSGF